MTDEAKTKDEESKFVAIINKEGRVEVSITGPHVNNKTLNRIQLAIKKTYRSHIKAYRKQVRRDMNKVEIAAIVAAPATLEVEANGRVLESNVELLVGQGSDIIAPTVDSKVELIAKTKLILEGKD